MSELRSSSFCRKWGEHVVYRNCFLRQKQFLYTTCNSMNNLLSYCGLVDAKIRASRKDLTVQPFSVWWHISNSLTLMVVCMPCQHLRGLLLKKKPATVVVFFGRVGPHIKGGRVPQRSSMEFFHKDIICRSSFFPSTSLFLSCVCMSLLSHSS